MTDSLTVFNQLVEGGETVRITSKVTGKGNSKGAERVVTLREAATLLMGKKEASVLFSSRPTYTAVNSLLTVPALREPIFKSMGFDNLAFPEFDRSLLYGEVSAVVHHIAFAQLTLPNTAPDVLVSFYKRIAQGRSFKVMLYSPELAAVGKDMLLLPEDTPLGSFASHPEVKLLQDTPDNL